MDGSIELSTILSLAGAITTVGIAWLTLRKIGKDFRKDRELEAAKIIQVAKEADYKLKSDLDGIRLVSYNELNTKIAALEARLDNLEQSVEKDLLHVRETFNGEIRNLGEKIEDLRADLQSQHSQLVGLLTKMIDKN
jgi:predicted RNase H-like nuclease (RuvC/YqgF family)